MSSLVICVCLLIPGKSFAFITRATVSVTVSNATATISNDIITVTGNGTYIGDRCTQGTAPAPGWLYRVLWFGDININGQILQPNINAGNTFQFDLGPKNVAMSKPLTKNGINGIVAVFGPPDDGGSRYQDCNWSFSTHPISLSYTLTPGNAVPAGVYNVLLPIAYEEYYYSNNNSYSSAINEPGLITTAPTSMISGNLTVNGYCAGGSFNPGTLVIDHGSLTAQTVNGDTKTGTISYQCNTDTLPVIRFSGTSNSFSDISLCNGVSSHLTYNTVTDSKFQFTTTFTSELSRTPQSTCSGAFSGSTVVYVTYN